MHYQAMHCSPDQHPSSVDQDDDDDDKYDYPGTTI